MGQSLLYVEPIYLQAESVASVRFPELKRVILATADRVVMEPTLDEAVRAIVGGRRIARPTDGKPVPGGISPDDLLPLLAGLRSAAESLRGGADELDEALKALDDLTGEEPQ